MKIEQSLMCIRLTAEGQTHEAKTDTSRRNKSLQLETSTPFYQKYTIELNSSIIQLDIIDIYRLIHPSVAEYAFFFQLTWNIHHNNPHLGP